MMVGLMAKPTPHQSADVAVLSALERYSLVGPLGKGGLGRVFRAELSGPAGFRKEVALKVLNADAAEQVASAHQDFLAEARLGGLLRHANIVDVYELGELRDGRHFIAMELVDGPTFGSLLSKAWPLPPSIVLDLMLQVAAGLEHAHCLRVDGAPAGLVHRDIKPNNLMIGLDGVVKIVDFGVAAAPTGRAISEAEAKLRGTPAYMSPEQMLVEAVDHRSDLFSLGLVLAELVTGERLIQGHGLSALCRSLLRIETVLQESGARELVEWTVPGLGAVLDRCLAASPDDRYASAAELEADLQILRDGCPAEPRLKTWLEQTLGGARPMPRRRPAGARPPRTLPGRRSRETPPPELDSFIGRADSLGRLWSLLDEGARLVTVKGPGGIGKTRLVRRHASETAASWSGGVQFCDLSAATTLAEAVGVVGAATRCRPAGVDTADQIGVLAAHIERMGRVLLVLDNFEQLQGTAEILVIALLHDAPEMTLVVTSRARLGLAGEQVLELQPLSPMEGRDLFQTRARAVAPDLAWTDTDEVAVAELVGRLDGIPLAIELAAGRSGLLGPAALLRQMAEPLKLLSGGSRNRPGRQATLRATMDWSWDMLAPWERSVLAQLSVFQDGFFLDAVEDVVRVPPHRNAPWVIDVIGALHDRSLVQANPRPSEPSAPRFRLLETIRLYAREKLEMDPALATAAHRRHQAHYARHGTVEGQRALYATGGDILSARLRLDLPNLLEAATGAAAESHPVQAADAALGAIRLVGTSAPPIRSVELARRTLALPGLSDDDQPAPVVKQRARLLIALGYAESGAGRTDEGLQSLRAGLASARRAGSQLQEASAHGELGLLLRRAGDLRGAFAHLTEARRLYRSLGRFLPEASVACNLGLVHAALGERQTARECYEGALRIHRTSGNEHGVQANLTNIGVLLTEDGELDAAAASFREAIAITRRHQNHKDESAGRALLGLAYMAGGRLDEALGELQRAIDLARRCADLRGEGLARGLVGEVFMAQGRHEEAAAVLQAAIETCDSAQSTSAHVFRGDLAVVHARRGEWSAARKLLAETGIRPIQGRNTMSGKLACQRGEVERLAGDLPAARSALADAAAILEETSMSPTSTLGVMIAELKERLETA